MKWLPIKNYEGLYLISENGDVKSLLSNKILKQYFDGNGYYQVSLYKNKIAKSHKIYRLVAEAFIPNPENKSQVDHINAIRTDNRVENLRWVTSKENANTETAIINKKKAKAGKNNPWFNKFGKDHNLSLEIIQLDLKGNEIKKWGSSMDIERELSFKHQNIISCCRGKLHTAYKYKWKYV